MGQLYNCELTMEYRGRLYSLKKSTGDGKLIGYAILKMDSPINIFNLNHENNMIRYELIDKILELQGNCSHEHIDDVLYISILEVMDEYKNHGYGRELFEVIKGDFPDKLIIIKAVPSSIKFWSKMGFKNIIDGIQYEEGGFAAAYMYYK